MNRREDELIRCAFGDVDAQDAEQIRARCQGDPKMARELAEYEAMKQGLHQLRDIPEMQLSRERLRDAILADGLNPAKKQAAPWWDRLAWPVALAGTAAMAFMVVTRLRPTELPLPGAGSGAPLMVEAPNTNANLTLAEPMDENFLAMGGQPFGSKFDFSAPASKPVANRTIVDSAPVRTASRSRRHSRSMAKEEAPAPSLEAIIADRADAPAMAPDGAFDSTRDVTFGDTNTLRREQAKPEDQGIVVIDPGQTEAGTQRAVEMEAAGNVLVGG